MVLYLCMGSKEGVDRSYIYVWYSLQNFKYFNHSSIVYCLQCTERLRRKERDRGTERGGEKETENKRKRHNPKTVRDTERGGRDIERQREEQRMREMGETREERQSERKRLRETEK